jgi:hypothetical protein
MTETNAIVCACGTSFPNQRSLGSHLRHCHKALPETRFWAKVEMRGDDECWGWTAQKRWDGYGRFVINYKPQWAHRYSYELHHGPIPQGMQVLHTCDNPACTNPKHLRLGTREDNMADKVKKGRACLSVTLEQVKEIKRLLAVTPRTHGWGRRIADAVGVDIPTVSRINCGVNYKHIQ